MRSSDYYPPKMQELGTWGKVERLVGDERYNRAVHVRTTYGNFPFGACMAWHGMAYCMLHVAARLQAASPFMPSSGKEWA